jgi:hypothetical protein
VHESGLADGVDWPFPLLSFDERGERRDGEVI